MVVAIEAAAFASLRATRTTLLPFVRKGYWWVRVWDFPRIQIAVLGLVDLAGLLALGPAGGLQAARPLEGLFGLRGPPQFLKGQPVIVMDAGPIGISSGGFCQALLRLAQAFLVFRQQEPQQVTGFPGFGHGVYGPAQPLSRVPLAA